MIKFSVTALASLLVCLSAQADLSGSLPKGDTLAICGDKMDEILKSVRNGFNVEIGRSFKDAPPSWMSKDDNKGTRTITLDHGNKDLHPANYRWSDEDKDRILGMCEESSTPLVQIKESERQSTDSKNPGRIVTVTVSGCLLQAHSPKDMGYVPQEIQYTFLWNNRKCYTMGKRSIIRDRFLENNRTANNTTFALAADVKGCEKWTVPCDLAVMGRAEAWSECSKVDKRHGTFGQFNCKNIRGVEADCKKDPEVARCYKLMHSSNSAFRQLGKDRCDSRIESMQNSYFDKTCATITSDMAEYRKEVGSTTVNVGAVIDPNKDTAPK